MVLFHDLKKTEAKQSPEDGDWWCQDLGFGALQAINSHHPNPRDFSRL